MDYKPLLTVEGPWKVSFDPKLGGPAEPVIFEQLADWTSRSEEGVKFYSGTATYRTSFNLQSSMLKSPLILDLGTVHALATVRLNGKDLGVVWCAPWRVDISKAAKSGRNDLEIGVVNTWLNRMVGDLALPAEKRVTTIPKRFPPNPKSPLEPSGLLGPITIQEAQ